MQPNIFQIFLIWLVPISVELLVGWIFISTVRRVEARNRKADKVD